MSHIGGHTGLFYRVRGHGKTIGKGSPEQGYFPLMSGLIFSPRVVYNDFLGVNFDSMQKTYLMDLTGQSRRTIDRWFQQGSIAKRSVFLNIMELYAKDLEGNFEGIACPIDSTEYIRHLKDPDWNSFALLFILSEDDLFRDTFSLLRYNLLLNSREFHGEKNFHRLALCLPPVILNNFQTIYNREKPSSIPIEMWKDYLEILALVFYLSIFEDEYFAVIGRKEPFLKKVLPSYHNGQKNIISTPIELFFQQWINHLVDQGFFRDKQAIAKQLSPRAVENATRVINRFMNDATPSSWYSFNTWINRLLPEEINGIKLDNESRASTIFYMQTLFGGARILDKLLKIFLDRFEGLDPVRIFQKAYSASKGIIPERDQGGSIVPP